MTDKPHVLPLLLGLCDRLDAAYIEAVGPFGQLVVSESRAAWLAAGPHLRTRDIYDYAVLLAREIEEPEARAQFIAAARALIGTI